MYNYYVFFCWYNQPKDWKLAGDEHIQTLVCNTRNRMVKDAYVGDEEPISDILTPKYPVEHETVLNWDHYGEDLVSNFLQRALCYFRRTPSFADRASCCLWRTPNFAEWSAAQSEDKSWKRCVRFSLKRLTLLRNWNIKKKKFMQKKLQTKLFYNTIQVI